MNVRNVNGAGQDNQNTLKTLLLLDEISKGESQSQRDLSNKLDLGLGLVNSYIKNLVAKGYLRVANIDKKNFKYFLTPTGVAEKSRLAYDLLRDYNRVFREARGGLKVLFQELQDSGAKRIALVGIDEVAELAYLSLQEFDLELAGIVDSEQQGKAFFKHTVGSFETIGELNADYVVVSSHLKVNEYQRKLIENGVPAEKIKTIFPVAVEEKGEKAARLSLPQENAENTRKARGLV